MTTVNFVSGQAAITDSAELPPPDATSAVNSGVVDSIALPRAIPNTVDSGRISFGAAMRLPVRK